MRPQAAELSDSPNYRLRATAWVAVAQMTDVEAVVRYARTSDGVNIAYGDAGEGQRLLFMSPSPLCHVQLDWDSLRPHADFRDAAVTNGRPQRGNAG